MPYTHVMSGSHLYFALLHMRRPSKRIHRSYDEYLQEVRDHWIAELEIYIRKHGHAYIGGVGRRGGNRAHPDRGLQDWCLKQRRLFAEGHLSTTDIIQLKKLGFDFSPPPRMYAWMVQYERLCSRYQTTGKRLHPSTIRDKSLANWADAQRQSHRCGTLRPLQVSLLTKMGFEWDPLIERWWENFALYAKGMRGKPSMFVETHLPETLQRWAEKQRSRVENGFMTEDQREALESIGFLWSRRRTAWIQKYEQYVQFTNNPPPAHSSSFATLSDAVYRWSAIQRQAMTLGRLDSQQIQLLHTAGFVFRPFDDTFHEVLQTLDAHIHKYGPLPLGLSQNVSLRKWISVQRTRYRNGTLEPERIAALNERNIEWNPLQPQVASSANAWEKHMRVCKLHFEQHGSLPSRIKNESDPILRDAAIYLQGLRIRYTNQQGADSVVLTPERIRVLERMNMQWEGKQSTLWETRIAELTAFTKKFKHAAVTRSMPGYEELGSWAVHLRSRKNEISASRLRQLDALDFVWDIRDERWDDNFAEVQASIAKLGRYSAGDVAKATAKWVVKQRTRYTRGVLDPERAQKLHTLGILESPHDMQFQRHIEELQEYKRIHGNTRVPHRRPDVLELSQWVASVRQRYQQGALPKEHINELEKIGFEWRLRAAKKKK